MNIQNRAALLILISCLIGACNSSSDKAEAFRKAERMHRMLKAAELHFFKHIVSKDLGSLQPRRIYNSNRDDSPFGSIDLIVELEISTLFADELIAERHLHARFATDRVSENFCPKKNDEMYKFSGWNDSLGVAVYGGVSPLYGGVLKIASANCYYIKPAWRNN